MAWIIKCADPECGHETVALNIVDLLSYHIDSIGLFLCSACAGFGFIKKSFKLQETNRVWKPYLRGIIQLGEYADTYQPFVFLVSNTPTGEMTDIWFSYYKDLRSCGGRLKFGYGPGGSPVLDKLKFIRLLSRLVSARYFSENEVFCGLEESTHRRNPRRL